jgi:hypothetical protein
MEKNSPFLLFAFVTTWCFSSLFGMQIDLHPLLEEDSAAKTAFLRELQAGNVEYIKNALNQGFDPHFVPPNSPLGLAPLGFDTTFLEQPLPWCTCCHNIDDLEKYRDKITRFTKIISLIATKYTNQLALPPDQNIIKATINLLTGMHENTELSRTLWLLLPSPESFSSRD